MQKRMTSPQTRERECAPGAPLFRVFVSAKLPSSTNFKGASRNFRKNPSHFSESPKKDKTEKIVE
jgi:hypothetical protein